MRLWHIPVGYLDRQRLQSQHYECHGLFTVCVQGKKWGAISAQFEKAVDYIELVHDRCAIEMGIRKSETHPLLDHNTPIDWALATDEHISQSFKPSREDFTTDVIQLRAKWEREAYLFGIGRMDLRFLEQRLDLPIGRDTASCWAMKDATVSMKKQYKDELKAITGDKRFGDKLDELATSLGFDPFKRTQP